MTQTGFNSKQQQQQQQQQQQHMCVMHYSTRYSVLQCDLEANRFMLSSLLLLLLKVHFDIYQLVESVLLLILSP